MPVIDQRILVVEPDPHTLELLVAGLVERFGVNITCVSTAEEAVEIESDTPHDLVICEIALPGVDGIELAEQLAAIRVRPMILIGEEPTGSELIYAMRAGVQDVFPKPFRVVHLLDSAERALRTLEMRRRHQERHDRLRGVVKHVIRERRELSRRTELICHDLVGAHRRLMQRVLDFEELRAMRK